MFCFFFSLCRQAAVQKSTEKRSSGTRTRRHADVRGRQQPARDHRVDVRKNQQGERVCALCRTSGVVYYGGSAYVHTSAALPCTFRVNPNAAIVGSRKLAVISAAAVGVCPQGLADLKRLVNCNSSVQTGKRPLPIDFAAGRLKFRFGRITAAD